MIVANDYCLRLVLKLYMLAIAQFHLILNWYAVIDICDHADSIPK